MNVCLLSEAQLKKIKDTNAKCFVLITETHCPDTGVTNALHNELSCDVHELKHVYMSLVILVC